MDIINVDYLLDREYDVKPVTTFIGNHYDVVMERCKSDSEYAILVFHDRYFSKGISGDRIWNWRKRFWEHIRQD